MPDANPVTILLIEDNLGDVMLFEEAIEGERTSIVLHTAKSVDEAIGLLAGVGNSGIPVLPTVILLDLHLPGKDGKAFLRHINKQAGLMSIPVIVLSSSTRQADVDDCLRLGSRHYRVKPRDWAGYQDLVVFLRQFCNGIKDASPDAVEQDTDVPPCPTPRDDGFIRKST